MRRFAVLFVVLAAFIAAGAVPAFADEPGPSSGDGPIDELIAQTEPTREFAEETAAALSCDPAPDCGKNYVVGTYVYPAVMAVVGEDGLYGTTIKPANDQAGETIDALPGIIDDTTQNCGPVCDMFCTETEDERHQAGDLILNDVMCSDFWGDECAPQYVGASFSHCTGEMLGAFAGGAAAGAATGVGAAGTGAASALAVGVACIIIAIFS